jgi:hypothetical protein
MVPGHFKERFLKAGADAWYKGNLDALDDVDDPDIIIHQPPIPDMIGRDAHKQYIAGARQAFSHYRQDWADVIVEGDTMAARYTAHMKHTGPSHHDSRPPDRQGTYRVCGHVIPHQERQDH